MVALGRPGVHPEGRFFPDSYTYAKGSSDLAVMRRAMQAMDKARDRTTPRELQATPGAPLPRARVPQLAHLGAGAGKPKAGGAADELTPEYMEEFRQALARGEALRYGS